MSNYIAGIVLSAGLSGRMNAFKPLLNLSNGKTFIQNIVEKLSPVCDEVIVVTGYMSDKIADNLQQIKQFDKINLVFNNNYKSGMFSSLQTGLLQTDSHWYLYHFVDQPSLPENFYSEFVKQIDNKSNWIQPVRNNRKGHPILFDNDVKKLIQQSGNDNTLRDVARDESIKKKYWEYDSEWIFQDIDTQNEYNSLHS